MYLVLGSQCNHNCIICPYPHNKVDMCLDLDVLLQTLENLINNGHKIDRATVSGGEPTLYPKLNEVLRFMDEQGIYVTILSNSEKFSDPCFTKINFSGVNTKRLSVVTAIHSHINSEHDRVTDKKGSFEKTIKGLHNLVENNIDVAIKHLITKLNYLNMELFTEYVYKEFPDNVKLLFGSIDYCGQAGDNFIDVGISFEESGAYIEKALDKVIEFRGMNHNRTAIVIETPLCSVDPFYWSFFQNRSDQNLPVSISPDIETGINSVFNVKSDCGTFFTACAECEVESICSGAWRTARDILGENAVHAIKRREEGPRKGEIDTR